MSQRADIFIHFCNDIYKEKMTVEERAELMVDLYEDLDYEDYDLLNDEGEYIGRDMQKAINALKKSDEDELRKIEVRATIDELESNFICAKQNKGEIKCKTQCGWCEGNN